MELKNENFSLRSLLKDYEETKNNEDVFIDRLNKAEEMEEEMNLKIQDLLKENQFYKEEVEKVKEEMSQLEKDNTKLEKSLDMNTNHLETKVRLLKEALNKRNEDVKELESNNNDLVKLLEKWDQKLVKLDEDYRLEKYKTEKYEVQLGLKNPDFQKYEIETIDGRISFMVNILEEYRKMLEEESQPETESKN